MQTAIAQVFTNRSKQLIQIPAQFQLNVDEVFISRSGNELIITPRLHTWEGFIEGLTGFSEEFSITSNLTTDIPRRTFD